MACTVYFAEAFRGGLRASRECYLVLDRERFAEVRNETLGRARGQEITPSLAGFGDSVTDFPVFRSGLQADKNRSIFTLRRPSGHQDQSAWWVVFAARWKQSAGWLLARTPSSPSPSARRLRDSAHNHHGNIYHFACGRSSRASACLFAIHGGRSERLPQ